MVGLGVFLRLVARLKSDGVVAVEFDRGSGIDQVAGGLSKDIALLCCYERGADIVADIQGDAAVAVYEGHTVDVEYHSVRQGVSGVRVNLDAEGIRGINRDRAVLVNEVVVRAGDAYAADGGRFDGDRACRLVRDDVVVDGPNTNRANTVQRNRATIDHLRIRVGVEVVFFRGNAAHVDACRIYSVDDDRARVRHVIGIAAADTGSEVLSDINLSGRIDGHRIARAD